MRETVLAEVAQRSPTSPETNLESRAMQVRVPWTLAWLCTKDFRRKCTGAGVAAKSHVSKQCSPVRRDQEVANWTSRETGRRESKEPCLKQVAPREVPETGTMRMCETVLAEVAQRSPTSPETNLESRAMQVRVPWTQAWLCTKDFRRKCTGAGVAAKSRGSQQCSPAR
ncbi:hypothetical protein NDU88_000585 [Pleurodeles waltl]|uniref:Uncharacterized protein n=1 Tax=Pleurodeles waltl TaxID=8319 RepID=A0AAV7VX18_PLEWA|nr:hypothetical protein NDU88_000585 [Pleurodeles waltl]